MFILNIKKLYSNNYLYLILSKKLSGNVDYLKKLYLPLSNYKYEDLKNAYNNDIDLLSKIGLLKQHNTGFYTLLPFMYKSCAKLIKLIEIKMNEIGAQRILMPNLYKIDLLKKSDRYANFKKEIFTFLDQKNTEMYLAPTHEEPIVNLLKNFLVLNKNQFPLLLYQIDSKFRKELRPRSGLIRTNQFLMKDLYSFDVDKNNALITYKKVCNAYNEIFKLLEIDILKVNASNGLMGGSLSHEFHMKYNKGNEVIYFCKNCNINYNKEKLEELKLTNKKCPKCQNNMNAEKSIELGHTFYLGNIYTSKFNFFYKDNSEKIYLKMCSYGLGVTRILATILNQNSNHECINYPLVIAPYHILIIPPKENSIENKNNIGQKMSNHFSKILAAKGFDILIDDRIDLTIGKRMYDCKIYGIPYVIIIGKNSIFEIPKFELITYDKIEILTHSEIIQKFENVINSKLINQFKII